MFKLVIQDDEGKTTVVPLIRDEITIGRKEGNTIRLTERNVSRKHAKISRNNGAVAIEDLGSYNGVKVNGTRILQKVTLNISDRVQIGDYLIELKAEGAEQPSPAFSEDARTVPIERLDPAAIGSLGMAPPPQPATGLAHADTDPARRPVAAPVPAAAPAPATPARLVVLSSNFAGREFAIAKSPCIIGRTDDNDVVINHRSISRNHAQILRDGAGRYSIEDLQSANGVRVNGEDYGKVELRRGDTIDLGHVRLRFVEPGEDFVFGRDAQVVDVPTAGGKKTWLWGLIGVGVIAAVIIVVVAGGGKKGKSEQVASGGTGSSQPAAGTGVPNAGSETGSSAGVAAGTGAGSGSGMATSPTEAIDAAVAVAPAIDAAPAVATGPGSGSAAVDNATVGQALAAARAAVESSDWATAAEKAKAALAADPGNADAKAIADQAKRESANKAHFDAFNAAASARQYDKAVTAFDKIATDSVYKNQARSTYDQLHDAYIADQVGLARVLAKSKQCDKIKLMARKAGQVFSDAKAEMEKVPCETGGGEPSGPGPGTSHGSDTTPPPTGGKTPEQLVDEASAAISSSQYARALSLAESALRMPGIEGGTKSKAVTVAGLAACNSKNAGKAKTYYGQLPANRKTLLRQACLKQGIDLEQ